MANMVLLVNVNSPPGTSLHYRSRAARRWNDCPSKLHPCPQTTPAAAEMERSRVPSSPLSADYGKEVASQPPAPQRPGGSPAVSAPDRLGEFQIDSGTGAPSPCATEQIWRRCLSLGAFSSFPDLQLRVNHQVKRTCSYRPIMARLPSAFVARVGEAGANRYCGGYLPAQPPRGAVASAF